MLRSSSEACRRGLRVFQALFDVSLEVRAGEAVAVIGPNGAGKTTLLRAISGLIDASAGEITMEGRDLTSTPAHRDRRARHRPRAGEPAAVPAPHGRGQPASMGAFPSARAKFAERLDFVYGCSRA